MNDLLVSYDTHLPGRNYAGIEAAIRQCGTATKIHQTFWRIRSQHGAAAVRDHIRKAMDPNDSLLVIDVAVKGWAAWNIRPDAVDALNQSTTLRV